jgi:HrpA-like RNA helicase
VSSAQCASTLESWEPHTYRPKTEVQHVSLKNYLTQMVVTPSRPVLPVAQYRDRIVDSVFSSEVTLISSETGSGKSTQIPQFLYDARHRLKRSKDIQEINLKLCVTQPRRVAAISLANRVASERGEKAAGGLVGYRVRFDERCSERSSILFLTDGMLVREAVMDHGSFQRYSIVILDEVHERSLHTDILLGLLCQAMKKRRNTMNPLKVVIMSATLVIESFKKFFQAQSIDSNLISVPGRAHPVSLWYTPSVEHDYVDATVCTIMQINDDEKHKDGDILVFLPGQEDIEAVSASLVARQKAVENAPSRELVVVHLYAALSNEAQAMAFDPVPPGTHRKIILSTNIAETSLTIPGIRYVIDCGLVKLKSVIGSQLEVLRIVPASKATVIQRAGRAGREAPGQCFRLYREADFDKLADQTPPEIVRCELSSALLQICAMGLVGGPKGLFPSLSEFPFIDKPSDQAIGRAELVLKRIGAMEAASRSITDYGIILASFPLSPLLAHLVMTSYEFGCVEEVLILASLLSVDNLWRSSKQKKSSAFGDHWALVCLFNQIKSSSSNDERAIVAKNNGLNPSAFGKASKIYDQLEKIAKKSFSSSTHLSSCGSQPEPFLRAMTKALWMNVAKLSKQSGVVGHYETIDKVECFVHPGSLAFGLKEPPPCLVFTEIVQTSKNYLRAVTPIDGKWLVDLVPTYFKPRS